jgi:hypothetical protein
VKSPECGVTEAARPEGLVEGNRYDTSVAAEIIADKFGYHLPIYRQQDLFAGSGWAPSRSTLLNIAESAGDLLPPFIDSLRDAVLASEVVGTDDTRVTLLLPAGGHIPEVRDDDPKSRRIAEVFAAARAENKPSVTARMWAYPGLFTVWENLVAVCYEISTTRKRVISVRATRLRVVLIHTDE